ncbi:MAG: PLP-dependent aminotransferase family protein [Clostridia bacterium]|nr:PLP-dependent aminotransferase family protein [Clostridia bacterium]
MIKLDYESKTPLYEQLYLAIKRDIEAGKIKANDKLPSKRNLSKMLKISAVTIESAYEQLKDEGYIYSVEKSGYFAQAISAKSQHTASPPIAEKESCEEALPSFLYDLRGEHADIESFPFSVWSKLSRQVLSEQPKKLLQRVSNQGLYELRHEISDYLRRYRGIEARAENIIVGAGTEYLLGLLVQLLPKAMFAVENPGYKKVSHVLRANRARVCHIPLDNDGIDMESLHNSSASVVYVTPSHHFPLGNVMPIKRRNELLSFIKKKKNRYIIEDDYDSEFRFSGRPIPTLYSIDNGENVIYFSTFTQSLCPSLRISYMLLPDNLMEIYNKNLSFYSSTVPSFEQYTLLNFMKDGYFERHLNRMRTIYKNRRDAFVTGLRQSSIGSKITVLGNNAGLSLLVRVNGLTESELIESAGALGVGISGLSSHYADSTGVPEGVVIIGYSSLNLTEIGEVVALLEKAWK